MKFTKDGKNSILIFDGNKAYAYSVEGREGGYNFEERVKLYLDETYWYLPVVDRRKVLLNHGISVIQIINNFVVFESITPNRNYDKHIKMAREMFPTSILINSNDGFLTDDIDNKIVNPITDKPVDRGGVI